MARPPQLTVDPAGDAASLLRRVGFLVLMIGCPLGALASRTAVVIVFAVGIAVVSAASVYGGVSRPFTDGLARLARSWASVAAAVVGGWAVLSLAWTPAPQPGGVTAFGLIGVAGAGLLGFLALPDRMRSANLYPMPVGVGIAALAALALALVGTGERGPDVARRMERGLAILVLFAWPALAWLRSRGRDVEALALAVVAAGTATLAPDPIPIVALAAGAGAYLLTELAGRRGMMAVASAFALAVLAAPAILAVLPDAAGTGWAAELGLWKAALWGEPARILTGRGVGAARVAIAGSPGTLFGSPLLGLWYDLGLVGAAGTAVAAWAAIRAASGSFGPLRPGLAAAFTTGAVLGLAGIDGGALWWPASLATVALLFVAAERGQFRTRRPRALATGRDRAA